VVRNLACELRDPQVSVPHLSSARGLWGRRSFKVTAMAVDSSAGAGKRRVVLWFRNDLRLHDNYCIEEAVRKVQSSAVEEVRIAEQVARTVCRNAKCSARGSWQGKVKTCWLLGKSDSQPPGWVEHQHPLLVCVNPHSG